MKKPAEKAGKAAQIVTISLRLTRETVRDLDELAKRNGIKRTAVMQIGLARILQTGI